MFFYDYVNCLRNYIKKRLTLVYVIYESIRTIISNRFFEDKLYTASIQKIDKNLYELTYTIHNKTYKILVRPKRGPNPVQQVNKNGEDVTHHVLPYLGPEHNYHGSNLTPMDLGHESLTFEMCDGTEYTFVQDQVLLKDIFI